MCIYKLQRLSQVPIFYVLNLTLMYWHKLSPIILSLLFFSDAWARPLKPVRLTPETILVSTDSKYLGKKLICLSTRGRLKPGYLRGSKEQYWLAFRNLIDKKLKSKKKRKSQLAKLTNICNSTNNSSASRVYSSANSSSASPVVTPTAGPVPASPYAAWSNGPSSDPNYFPLGVWLQSPHNAAKFKQQLGINQFIGYYGEIDQTAISSLASQGMPVIPGQNTAALTSPQNSIIDGWSQMDEPDNAQWNGSGYDPCIPPSQIIAEYNAIKAKDSTRPVYVNFGRGVADINWIGRGTCTGNTAYYSAAAAAGDILSFDIYPVWSSNGRLEFIYEGVSNLRAWAPSKIIWNFIETAGDASLQPTASQVKTEVWMALTAGSQGIGYWVHEFKPSFREDGIFNHPEIVAAVKAINEQIISLAPVLNSPTVANAVQVTSAVPLGTMVKHYNGSIYLFAVVLRPTAVTPIFTLNGVTNGSVEVLGENRQLSISNGSFQDSFAGYGVHLYRVTG